MNKIESLNDVIEYFCVVYNRSPIDVVAKGWHTALHDLTPEQLKHGYERCVKEHTGPIMPTPAQFRDYSLNITERDAVDAWNQIENTIKTKGMYRTVAFKNSAIHTFINDTGGWPALCRNTTNELKWLKKDFIGNYKHYHARPQYIPYLLGLDKTKTKKDIIFIGFTESEIEKFVIHEPPKQLPYGLYAEWPTKKFLESMKKLKAPLTPSVRKRNPLHPGTPNDQKNS